MLDPLSLPHENDEFYDHHRISAATVLMQSLLSSLGLMCRPHLCFVFVWEKSVDLVQQPEVIFPISKYTLNICSFPPICPRQKRVIIS